MDWYTAVFELIDMRSFSNLWYWIALAVMWSSASHWILGVPWDMVLRAQRGIDGFERDLCDVVRVNVNRILHIGEISGLWVLGLCCFVLTSLALLGFVYGQEFAQAVFLLAFPMSFVGLLTVSTAQKISNEVVDASQLLQIMTRQRMIIQALGMVSIFVTSLWGMYQNFSYGPLN